MIDSGLMELAAQFGIPGALVLFFIWRDWKRESYLLDKLERIEHYQTNRFEQVVERNTEVIEANTRVLERVLEVKPCMTTPSEGRAM